MSEPIRSFRDLKAWQIAMEICRDVYLATAAWPDAERFGLTAQIRRAAVSVPSNIAEGYGRGSTSDYLRFCRMSRGSLFEVETQLLIAVELRYIDHPAFERIESRLHECGRVLAGLLRSVEASVVSGPRA